MSPDLAVPELAGVDETERRSSRLFALLHHPATGERERRRLRDEIIECNMPLVTRLARRYQHRGQNNDDLVQVAAFALVKAVDSFDPARGKPFFGYLTPCVVGELKRHFRDKGWTLHLCRRLQERHLELAQHQAVLTHRWGRAPTVAELAAAMRTTQDDVVEGLAAGRAYRPESLNARVSDEHDSSERQDLLGAEDPALASLCDHLALRELLHRLPERDRFIVTRYFYDEATQDQIAEELGMSQMNVSRLLRGILGELRRRLDGESEDKGRAARARSRHRIFAYPAGPRDQVIAVTGDFDDAAAGELRDVLVDTAVRLRPRRTVVDLRGLGEAGGSAARALVDGYRAGGCGGTTLIVVNVPPTFLNLLGRLGVDRLFPCHPAAAPEVVATAPRRRPATAEAQRSAGGAAATGRPEKAMPCPAQSESPVVDRRSAVLPAPRRSPAAGAPPVALAPRWSGGCVRARLIATAHPSARRDRVRPPQQRRSGLRPPVASLPAVTSRERRHGQARAPCR